MTDHTLPSARPGAANAGTQSAQTIFGKAERLVAQPQGECKPSAPWWTEGTERRPFPRPLAYGFIRHRWFGPVRFSVRPGPGGLWLLNAHHPFPDVRVDRDFTVGELVDRRAVADRMERHGCRVLAELIRGCDDWLEWMLDVVGGGMRHER